MSRQAFVEFLVEHPGALWHMRPEQTAWQTFVALQLNEARDRNDLPAFRRWLDEEPWVLAPDFIDVGTDLMLPACYQKDRDAFIATLLERGPAVLARYGSHDVRMADLLAKAAADRSREKA